MAECNSKASASLLRAFEKGISYHIVKPLRRDTLPKAVILSYHNIPSDRDISAWQPDSVSVENFEKQMQFLVEQDFYIISLSELVKILRRGEKICAKTVVITFDDGYKTFLLNAWPVLQKYNLPTTVFVAVDYLGKNKSFPWLVPLARQKKENLLPMNWHDILELKQLGVEIGSHTCSHQFLPAMSWHDVENEVIHSGHIIERRIGIKPRALALPFSFPLRQRAWPDFQTTFFQILENGGYNVCCTSTRGTIDSHSHPYRLGRFFINKYDDLSAFHAKALGAFSWTRFPQFIYQRFFKNYSHVDYDHIDQKLPNLGR